jgi:hypothetical protein
MKNIKGDAKRKAWEEGRCLGYGEKGHLIATCPKVCYAKRVLKHLDQALKEGYKPKGEKKDKEGKPKRHLRVSATKQRVPRRILAPDRLRRGTLLRDPAPVRTRKSRETTPPGLIRARIRKAKAGPQVAGTSQSVGDQRTKHCLSSDPPTLHPTHPASEYGKPEALSPALWRSESEVKNIIAHNG